MLMPKKLQPGNGTKPTQRAEVSETGGRNRKRGNNPKTACQLSGFDCDMISLKGRSVLSLGVLLFANVWAFSTNRLHAPRLSVTTSSSRVRTMVRSSKLDQDEKTSGNLSGFSNEVMDEANNALASVGWAKPMDDGEMTSDDPFVQQIDAGIQRDFGVNLEDLLNPAKVVNLERDLYNLRSELAVITGMEDTEVAGMSTEDCDGGGGGEEADAVRKSIAKKEADLAIERRSVFRGWLKNIFLGQAILSFAISWVMVSNPAALFGGFDWFTAYNMDTPIRVLGFWWWWLFIVPSLRSRRPSGAEKKALDIAFLGTPLISIIAPAATKDTALIWGANFAVVAAAYAFSFAFDNEDDDDADDSKQPAWLKFIYKSLDFGSGRERGARK